ncbi:hypothetical protein MNBD_ALPHA03-1970 [hydrothermal vent metagenome]|uniref:HEPN domain-containing protein n=1 Tax=hydrothermal vent metagenome TaxID=652676 RepID=A0A3B1BNI1_9ZZZZ
MQDLSTEERTKRVDIVAEYGGILRQTEAFYIQSIIYCAQCAESAFSSYDECLAEGASPTTTVSKIHEALSHVAALSRFFWPVRSKSKLHSSRAERLKKAFLISDTSPLIDKNLRELRNALEHFDERLDEFLLKNDTGQFFPTPIVDDSENALESTAKIFKLVDPERHVFIILGEKFDFSGVRDAIDQILQKSVEFNEEGRLPLKSTSCG